MVSGKGLELWDSPLQVTKLASRATGRNFISHSLTVFCLFIQLPEVQGSGALVQPWYEVFEAPLWPEINLRRTGQNIMTLYFAHTQVLCTVIDDGCLLFCR